MLCHSVVAILIGIMCDRAAVVRLMLSLCVLLDAMFEKGTRQHVKVALHIPLSSLSGKRGSAMGMRMTLSCLCCFC